MPARSWPRLASRKSRVLMSMAGIAMTSSLTPCITPSGNRPPGLQAPKVGCAGARSPAMLGRLGAARRGRLPGLTGRGALVMRHAHGACTLGAQRESDTTPSGRPGVRPRLPTAFPGVAHGAIIGRETMQTPRPAPVARVDARVCARWMPLRSTTRTTGCLVAVRHAVPLGLPRGVLRRTCAPEREDGHHGTIC
jgi:hypothetical protein